MRVLLVVLVTAVATLARNASPKFGVRAAHSDTNAKRFALGMPPLKPKLRRTRVASAPRAQTSPTPPTQVSCNVLATFLNGTTFGYLSRSFSTNHTYYAFEHSTDDALLVSFSYTDDDYHQISLTTNGPQNQRYPYLGGVLAPESVDNNLSRPTNYAYLAGTTDTPPGSIAVTGPNTYDNSRPMETAIWVYGAVDQSLIPQWVNSANSGYSEMPTTHLVYISDEQRLVVTGDPLALLTAHPYTATILRFKCVPPVVPV
ncbi:hypothetical protein RhiJN_21425 [Ceratobasidium sp. AG-Ba]|nr:hypothetical protein RhiJN_21425 [Ceratobasidium sp. AG-Ba]